MKVRKANGCCLAENNLMKKPALFIIVAVIIVSCSNESEQKVRLKENEKIISSYVNGTPQIVREYDEKDSTKGAVFQREYYEDGTLLKEGPVQNKKRNGYWKTYHKNGKLMSEGNFQNGLLEDTVRGYYSNGNPKYVGIYKDGIKTGVWLIYDETGKLTENKVYMQPGETLNDSLHFGQ
jgi:antitoxin component YwqK of YwqJK toxin-antitoxin module